ADGDPLETKSVVLGERGPRAVGTAVGVTVQLGRGALDRLERGLEGAERPFVRGKLDDSVESELALDLLYGLTGLVRHEIANGRSEEAVGDLGETLFAQVGHSSNLLRLASASLLRCAGPRCGCAAAPSGRGFRVAADEGRGSSRDGCRRAARGARSRDRQAARRRRLRSRGRARGRRGGEFSRGGLRTGGGDGRGR